MRILIDSEQTPLTVKALFDDYFFAFSESIARTERKLFPTYKGYSFCMLPKSLILLTDEYALDALYQDLLENNIPADVIDTWKKELAHHLVVACGVVVNDGEILCMQRGQSKYDYISYHWEFPGGKIEKGETPEEALHRELMEEMDYDVKVGEHLYTVEHEYPDFIVNLSAYLCTAESRDFNMKEHAASQWVKLEDIEKIDFCPADKPIIDKIKDVLRHD